MNRRGSSSAARPSSSSSSKAPDHGRCDRGVAMVEPCAVIRNDRTVSAVMAPARLRGFAAVVDPRRPGIWAVHRPPDNPRLITGIRQDLRWLRGRAAIALDMLVAVLTVGRRGGIPASHVRSARTNGARRGGSRSGPRPAFLPSQPDNNSEPSSPSKDELHCLERPGHLHFSHGLLPTTRTGLESRSGPRQLAPVFLQGHARPGDSGRRGRADCRRGLRCPRRALDDARPVRCAWPSSRAICRWTWPGWTSIRACKPWVDAGFAVERSPLPWVAKPESTGGQRDSSWSATPTDDHARCERQARRRGANPRLSAAGSHQTLAESALGLLKKVAG